MIQSRMKTLIVPLAPGSDPDVIEIEDCREVYGDALDLFPAVEDPACMSPDNPNDFCIFDATAEDPHRCKYCGLRDAV